jgi:putative phage-type endonuclease
MIKDNYIEFFMSPTEYLMKIILENPLIYSDPNYKTLLISSLRSKYYFEPSLEEIILHLDDHLREIDQMRSEESMSYPSILQEGHLDRLKETYQPEQRTPEWYTFRHDHITASNAWKALGSNASKNQLIYEKCQSINTEKYKSSLTETPMSWGNKYEYLTTCIYEEKNNTTIGTFGCIAHKDYPFLAASPDGIVTGENNYGRMIEIKNVVSREITGIPKQDYYIQMQLQMEVCDLEECDFVETKFMEYETEQAFKEDTTCLKKGVILVFINEEQEFVYRYMPFDVTDYTKWMEDTFDQTPYNWFKNVYWKLEVYSCVLVKRRKEWFKAAVPFFIELWDTILKERVNGEYLVRAPKKRVKQEKKTEPKNETLYENKNEFKPDLLVNVDGPLCDQT